MRKTNNFTASPYFGIWLTVLAYWIATVIRKNTSSRIFNVTLVASLIVILSIEFTNIPISDYQKGGDYIALFIGPCTVALAVPLYKNFKIIRKYWFSVLLGTIVGIIVSAGSVIVIGKLMGMDSLLITAISTKSVTLAIALEIVEALGGITTIAALLVMLTGITGPMLIVPILEKLKIKSKLARGLTYGVVSHILGATEVSNYSLELAAYASVGASLVGLLAPIIIPLIAGILL